MTGKDLIIYILENNLENEEVLKGGVFIGFMNEEEAALKFEVGIATIKAWYELGMLQGTDINGSAFFKKNISNPIK